MTIDRRKFGKTLLACAAGTGTGLFFPAVMPGADSGKSQVLIARSQALIRDNHGHLRREKVFAVVNRLLMRLTGNHDPAAAWKSLFSPGEKVGVKLSCLPGKRLSSSPGLVMAIADGLKSAGIREQDIFIWDRTDRELIEAGFDISHRGINVLGTDNIRGGGYSDRVEISGSVGTCFSRILEAMDALISVPVLKDHDIAGVSIGMKNFFGAIHNPNKFHQNACDPYVADLCRHPFIKNRLRLIVCDASRVQVHNGPAFFPGYAWEYGGILVSADPVALDYTGWQIIEKRRKELGLKSLRESGREPAYIFTAGKLGLGRANEKAIRVVEI
jgi:uncharacterized protein (DUF362 family)